MSRGVTTTGRVFADAERASAELLPWVLFAFFAALYSLTYSQQYDLDVIGELRLINELASPRGDPAHPLYVWIGTVAYRAWLLAGYAGDSLRVMQAVNAILGAGSVSLLYRIARQFQMRRDIGFVVAACVGVSYAFWTHTVDAFFIVPACFLALLTLSAKLSARCQTGWRAAACLAVIGVSAALSILAYQNNALLLPAYAVASWSGRQRVRSWAWRWAMIGIVAACVLVPAWLSLARLDYSLAGLLDLPRWLISAHAGMGRGLWRREGVALLPTIVTAWVATVFPLYEGMRIRALLHGEVSFPHLVGQATMLLYALAAVRLAARAIRCGLGGMDRAWARPALVCALWFALPGAAVAWFDPAEVKLWLIPMLGLWLFLGMMWNDSSPAVVNEHRSGRRWLAHLSLPLLLAATNWSLAVGPDHLEPSAAMAAARYAVQQMSQRDLLVSSTFDWTAYVSYLQPEYHVLNAVSVAQSTPKSQDLAVYTVLHDRAKATWSQGGRVFLMPYFADADDPLWHDWITPNTGLVAQDFAHWETKPAWSFGDAIVVEGTLR